MPTTRRLGRRVALVASLALLAVASSGCAKKQTGPPPGATAAPAAPGQPARSPDKDVMPGGGPGGGK